MYHTSFFTQELKYILFEKELSNMASSTSDVQIIPYYAHPHVHTVINDHTWYDETVAAVLLLYGRFRLCGRSADGPVHRAAGP